MLNRYIVAFLVLVFGCNQLLASALPLSRPTLADVGVYHNPETGRFWTQDSYEGNQSDPLSLHKYTYCHNNPVNSFDPSGQAQLVETMVAAGTRAVLQARLAIGSAFLLGQRYGGQALRYLGEVVENTVAALLRSSGAIVEQGVLKVTGPGGNRVIDLLVKAGDKVAWLETKYKLPSKAGEQLNRLVGQMQSATASATSGQQVVLFTFKEPEAAELARVIEAIGPTASPIQYVWGFRGLINWFELYFH